MSRFSWPLLVVLSGVVGLTSYAVARDVEATTEAVRADLPREVKDAVSAFEEDAAAIRAEAEKKIEKRKAELVARLKKIQDDLTKANKRDEAVLVRDALEKFADGFPEGTHVDVEWKGTWWAAQVLEAKEGKWMIKYDGYGDNWNEWVDAKRIRPRSKPAPGADAIEFEVVPVE